MFESRKVNRFFIKEVKNMAEQGDSKWNIGRLLSTLNYFGEVPFIGSFRWMQQLLGQSSTSPGITLNAKQKKNTADRCQLL